MTGEQYLNDHSISLETAKGFGLLWSDSEISIPIVGENNELLFYKHRNLKYDPNNPESQKYRYDSGSRAALFNYSAVKEKSFVVISEGEVDCIRLNQEDIPSVSSTGGANTFKEEWVELIGNKTIFICYDNDDAGRKGTQKLFELFPEAKAVVLPDETKDICDYFTAGHTRNDFVSLLREALELPEWNQKYMPEEFSLISAAELRTKTFEDEPWIMEKIIYAEGFCFIYGAEGTGKSFITLSIADAVARGQDWLGQFKVARPGKVLFIDKENPTSMTAKRLTGLDISSENIFWLKYPEKLSLVDGKGELSPFANALSSIVQAESIDLIIIDSFVDLMVGTENKAEDTQMFFDAIRQLFPKKAILVLHHENKPIQGAYRTDSQRMRGSSNINAQTNTQFRLETVAKSKTELTLKQTKARDAQRLDKFMIRMDVETQPDGTTLVKGFRYVGIVDESEDAGKTQEAQQTIESVLNDNMTASRQDIIKAGETAGISKRTMERTLNDMSKDGTLEKFQRGREMYYTLNISVKNEEEDD